MNDNDKKLIADDIAPRLANGEISLLLGAGFSITNRSNLGQFPTGKGLAEEILTKLGIKDPKSGTLKDAYFLGKEDIPNFNDFLKERFTSNTVYPWQTAIFKYEWKRIYTTNIDDVLDLSFEKIQASGKSHPSFTFLNFTAPNTISSTLGAIPVVNIHGTIKKINDGFVFDGIEYGEQAISNRDWINDIGANLTDGGMIIIGNRLDESDFDAVLARRKRLYGSEARICDSWIVMPDADEISQRKFSKMGYKIIESTGEEFFTYLWECTDRLISERHGTTPLIHSASQTARMWFREAFRHIPSQLINIDTAFGILKKFLNGVEPNWYFISNSAHADISIVNNLQIKINEMMSDRSKLCEVIHVVGPTGCGKSTSIMSSLFEIAKTTSASYEFDSMHGIDIELLIQIINGIPGDSIFVFYNAHDYYFAISNIVKRLASRRKGKVIFILEDRSSDYNQNKRHLEHITPVIHQMPIDHICYEDAILLAEKMKELGVVREKFTELDLDHQAKIILDKERGCGGDLLSTMFSVTTGDDFKEKIINEYHEISSKSPISKKIIDYAAIANLFSINLPISYLADFLNTTVNRITDLLYQELDGVLIHHIQHGRIKCRHKIIAQEYFEQCIERRGEVEFIIDALKVLSKKFTIADIKHHPIAYQLYRNIINYDYLCAKFFPTAHAYTDTHSVYNAVQKDFSGDGLFWAQYGRLYLKGKHYDEAIDCLKTGIAIYDSFQARHMLGDAHMKRYIYSANTKEDDLISGIELLEKEHGNRFQKDPYPLSTLCSNLLDLRASGKSNAKLELKLSNHLTEGIRLFKGDEYFETVLKRYYAER